MSRQFLCTVGTSLKSNAERQGRKGTDIADLTQFIREVGEVPASAETNSLSRIIRDGDQIIFFYSETEEGRLCAEALSQYYNRKGIRATERAISGLSYAHEVFAMKGLRRLVDSLIDEIRLSRRMGTEPVIVATGGFKAEIAYATLVGLLFKVPVYYIHEIFKDVIEMPPVPVDWDYRLLAECEEFFEWLQEEIRRTEKVEKRLQNLPPEIRLFLIDDDEGYTWLSPAGEVYYRYYSEIKQQAASVMISQQALKYYSDLSQERKEILDKTLRRLVIGGLRAANSGQVHNSDCFVYPRGYRPERIFYTEKDGVIYIYELALHEDNYEQLLKRGVYKRNYSKFEPFPVKL